MDKQWFQVVDGRVTEHQIMEMRVAYRNTFLKSEEGKQVLCHLKTTLESMSQDSGASPDARVAAMEIYEALLSNMGIVDNMAIVKALSHADVDIYVPQEYDEDNILLE